MGLFRSSLTTLIFLDEARLVRCDIDLHRQQVVSLRIRPRPLEGDWGTLVETALAQDASRPARVWVLATDAWSQKITVAGVTVAGLKPQEIARSLAFEAESFSGLAAFDSDVSYTPLGQADGLHEFWVTQVPRAVLNRVDQVVRERGGRLQGILHPAGMPQLVAGSKDSWTRIESWSGLQLAVTGRGDEAAYEIANLDRRNPLPISQAWSETLIATPGGIAPPAETTWKLQDEQVLSAWLVRWGMSLAQGPISVPVIRPEPKPIGKEVYIATAIGIAMIVAAVVWFDYVSIWKSIDDGNREVAKLNSQQELAKTLTKEQETLKTQLKKLGDENHFLERELATVQSATRAYRERWQKLLHVLAVHHSSDVVIQEIIATGGTIEIRGKCLGTDAVHDVATRVAADVRPFGWQLSPAQKSIADSEVYDYVWTLHEIAPDLSDNQGQILVAREKPTPHRAATTSLDTSNVEVTP